MARRRQTISRFKTAVAHADTFLGNTGSGSVPQTFAVLETEAGLRTTTGATQTIQDSASTGEVVRTGDIVKYINLFVQICARNDEAVAHERTGWLEWALVMVKESETTVPSTAIGTQTLGVICNNMFRNECIFTGNIPCFNAGANSLDIKIKVPKFKQKIRIGDEWRFITYWRSSSSTDVSTTAMRLIKSFMYKTYS